MDEKVVVPCELLAQQILTQCPLVSGTKSDSRFRSSKGFIVRPTGIYYPVSSPLSLCLGVLSDGGHNNAPPCSFTNI